MTIDRDTFITTLKAKERLARKAFLEPGEDEAESSALVPITPGTV